MASGYIFPVSEFNKAAQKQGQELVFAIKRAKKDDALALIEQGIGLQEIDGFRLSTPLHLAVDRNQFEIAEKLIAAGADLYALDEGGDTPVHLAARKKFPQMLELMIKSGASLNKVARFHEDGTTLLIAAVQNGCVQNVQLLLDHGANPNAQDIYNNTALHYACSEVHHYDGSLSLEKFMPVVRALKEAGVDPEIKNNNGKTAYHLAMRRGGSFEIVREMERLKLHSVTVTSPEPLKTGGV